MSILRMTDLDLAGKRVLIREDLNVPVEDGRITSEQRIAAALPTLRSALDEGRGGDGDVAPGPAEGRAVERGGFARRRSPTRLAELLGRDVPLVRDWLDGVDVAARPARAARELPHERRRGQGRRGAVEEVRRAVRRVRDGRLRHRAPRAGVDARRDPAREGRRRRPAADGRTRRAGEGAREPGAAAAGDRRRLQGRRPSSSCCRTWSARSTS